MNELRQVDGSLYVVYNMGLASQPVGELEFKVNDGRYHVLRFSRRGQNASVQIDDRPPHSKHPPGNAPATTAIRRPFKGVPKIFHWGSKTEGREGREGVGFLGRGSNPIPTS